MRGKFVLLFFFLFSVGQGVLPSISPLTTKMQSRPSVSSRSLMVHYMPWFEANPTHKKWGWHWTMNHYHPDQITKGKPEVASHYLPLIDLYDSHDPDTLECQVLLMKFAGIDGVIIDWYGKDDFLDYGLIHRNTLQLIKLIKKAGLSFAVCYEDQSVPKLVSANRISQTETLAYVQNLLAWMQTNWFTDNAYLKQNNRPVFLVFGQGYYKGDQWSEIFSKLPQVPEFFTESSRRAPAVGAFDWPQPGGGTEAGLRETDAFYTRTKEDPQSMPTAFPRFHDIYAEAGVQKSWGKIEDRKGKTYTETLERALKSQALIVQIATWNDWGEGTQIEPSVEFGYRDLEVTQRLRRKHLNTSFPYRAQDLRLPVLLYKLRKKLQDKEASSAKLESTSQALFAGEVSKARRLLSELSKQH